MSRSALRLSFVVALLFVSAHAHAFATKCLNPNTTRRYVPCEIDITLNTPVGNPYATIEVGADFTHATAPPVHVYGFLLSNSVSATVYRIRFNPTTEGTWSYTFFSSSSNAYVTNLGGQSFNVGTSPKESGFIRRDKANGFATRVVYDCTFDGPGQCPPEANPASPITAPNGVDHPFYWGQTYYQIINNAATPSSSWQTAITTAKAKGFRKVRLLVYPWNAEYNGSYGGVLAKQSIPFVAGTGCQVNPGCGINSCTIQFNQVNLTHFNTLDTIVNFMHTNGMGAELIIFKDQAAGNCGRTFSNSATPDLDNERYAKYVVARYAAYDNVTFSLSNEWQGTPYSAMQWNALAEKLKPYDPFRIHPRTQNLRLMTIHSHEGVKPDVSLAVASADNLTGWMSSASLQWSQFSGSGFPGSSNPPDQWGDEIIFGGTPIGIPVIDDEFGYLKNFDTGYPNPPYPATEPRFRHRNAMWGLATAAIYGSVGDTRHDATTLNDITLRSEWRDRAEWDDFQRMAKFFSDPAAAVPIPEFWRMRRRDTVYYNPARHAWLTGFTNRYFVLYDALGKTANSAITFTLPALPVSERYDVWRYDPTLGTYTKLNDLSDLAGTTITITPAHELNSDTVFLIKALPFP
jgi:hypothetical protein